MTTTRVKVTDFVKASRTWAAAGAKAANADGSKYLTRTEASRLPEDLRDNFAAMNKARISPKAFADAFATSVATAAARADKNHDGFLTATEAKSLPVELRDNFAHYAKVAVTGVKDTTTTAVRRAHEAAYGSSNVSYAEAFKRAKDTILTYDGEEGPRATLQEFADEPLSKAKLDALIAKRFHGLELLPVGESEESYGEPAKDWIFRVDVDTGTDNAFWVSISRETGEASISSFN